VIRVFVFRDGKGAWGGAEVLPERDGPFEALWIDLETPAEQEERKVFEEFFKVHPLTLEDILRPRRQPDEPPHFPKVEEFPDYLFVVVNPLLPVLADKLLGGADHERLNSQLSAVLTERMLITHHYEPLAAVQELHAFLGKHPTQAGRGPDFLFHLVLDVMVDEYAPILDQIDGSLDALEEEVFRRPRRNLLSRLLGLKRSIILLRKTMIYEREVLARLARGDFDLIDEREMVYYRNVYDHLIRFTELIEASREMVMDLMQTLLAAQANKLNEIMKVLTMISTTVLPMTLIAGIYGMNFEKSFWPHNEAPWAFGFALGLMGLCGVIAFGLFRWLKWI
jgi:magnesium transporter